jgi:hypothetical protein
MLADPVFPVSRRNAAFHGWQASVSNGLPAKTLNSPHQRFESLRWLE